MAWEPHDIVELKEIANICFKHSKWMDDEILDPLRIILSTFDGIEIVLDRKYGDGPEHKEWVAYQKQVDAIFSILEDIEGVFYSLGFDLTHDYHHYEDYDDNDPPQPIKPKPSDLGHEPTL